MVNGTAVLAHVPEPPSEAAEIEVGEAIASAACGFCFALQEFQQNGGLTDVVRAAGGERIARVAQLQLGHELGDRDFTAIAHRAGKAVLRQFFDGSFSPAQCDAALDFYINEVLMIVSRVVAMERALMH